jgi:2-dehydro-3-deoxyphosphogluconate aldolase / (4S)-4-hydroxy-2-oxoglutarate aldolase
MEVAPGQAWRSLLHRHRAIAVIRCTTLAQGRGMAEAVAAGGMPLIEITWNSDRPAALVNQLREILPDCVIGAGTVLSLEHAQDAIAAGAQYLFTPHVDVNLIHWAADQHVPLVAGALSPTEIIQAWRAGAACVKIFPVQAVGGADYIRCLQGPLDQIPLIPTGGVTVDNADDFLRAGAIAVGLAGDLFPKEAIVKGDWAKITQQAQRLLTRIAPERS